MFKQGHTINQGRPSKGGRKPKRSTDIRKQLELHPDRVWECLDIVYQEATTNHSIDAAKYYVDQVIGRARQSIDNRTSITLLPTPDDYALARVTLLEQGTMLKGLGEGGLDGSRLRGLTSTEGKANPPPNTLLLTESSLDVT